MKFKLVIFLFLGLCLNSTASLRCDLLKLLQHPSIVSDTSFWEKYAELAKRNKLNDHAIEKLLSEYHLGVTAHQVPAAKSKIPHYGVETTKKANKDLAKLPKDLKLKFEEFMEIVSGEEGIQAFYKNPGRWHFEKLVNKDSYTVRLNGSVRVHFSLQQGKIHIIQVNADHVHDHLK